MDKVKKSGAYKANIEIDKNVDVKVVTSIDNFTDAGGKVTNKYISFVNFVFAAFAATNYASNFNLVITEEILLNAAISISNKFFAIFAAFANTILEKKPKACKFNPFLYATNY